MVGLFAILVLISCFCFTVLLLYQYPSKSTPALVYILVFIGWFTPFTIVALLPYDVYLSQGGEGSKSLLRTAWVIVYWTSFCLCWLVLPIAEKFHTSGEFSFFSRLRNALYKQVRSFVIILLVLSALVVYLYFVQNLTPARLPEILVLMSNIWGLLLVITLLGYGLVFLPKACWNEGSLDKTLLTLQLKSVPLDEAVTESRQKMDECVERVVNLAGRIQESSPLRTYIEIVLQKCPEPARERQRALASGRRAEAPNTRIEYSQLVELHKELKDRIADCLRTQW